MTAANGLTTITGGLGTSRIVESDGVGSPRARWFDMFASSDSPSQGRVALFQRAAVTASRYLTKDSDTAAMNRDPADIAQYERLVAMIERERREPSS